MSEEKYGFRIGQKVRLVSGGGEYPLHGYKNGYVYEISGFNEDEDGEWCSMPVRLGPPENSSITQGFAYSEQIRLINPHTTVTGPATITVAEGETITFDGNATVKHDWVPKFGDRVTFVDPPEDMVGDFGVVTEIDDDDLPCRVVYNAGLGSKLLWYTLSEIKPYKAA